MLSGLVATTIYQDMIMGTQKDQFPDFKMSAIYPPYFKTPMCQTGSWHYGISSKTQHFDEALAFVKFASSDEGATFIWNYKSQLPANINLLNTLPDFKDVKERKMMADFFMKYGKPRITSAAYTEYNSLFSEFWNALMAGEDVETLAKDYAQQMQDAAATYKP
jgi:ABC-type glycerol-3-phosphate transport system substrate-binding protein